MSVCLSPAGRLFVPQPLTGTAKHRFPKWLTTQLKSSSWQKASDRDWLRRDSSVPSCFRQTPPLHNTLKTTMLSCLWLTGRRSGPNPNACNPVMDLRKVRRSTILPLRPNKETEAEACINRPCFETTCRLIFKASADGKSLPWLWLAVAV